MDISNIINIIRKFISGLMIKKTVATSADKEGEVVSNNKKVHLQQIRNLITLLIVPAILTFVMIIYIKHLGGAKGNSEEVALEKKKTSIELASESFDPDKYWRNHQEEKLYEQQHKFDAEIDELKEQQQEMISSVKKLLNTELHQTREQLNLAKAELADAALELKTAREEKRNIPVKSSFVPAHMNVNEVNNGIAFDMPKPTNSYIPEGTYFTGHLPGGIVVSTGLSAPDEKATPVIIRLISRGNLAAAHKLEISKCRIRGSAYGDLSSERAIVRLEKLICEVDGNYITSLITGQLYGPDGLNGIKGEVIAISEKHVRSAVLGGVLSGFASSVRGQDGASISGLGLMQTEKKGFKDMAKSSGFEGVAAAGEKIADFYLRQAERMSPVLVIPGGVRVNAQITEGFFFGEMGTHQRVKDMREKK